MQPMVGLGLAAVWQWQQRWVAARKLLVAKRTALLPRLDKSKEGCVAWMGTIMGSGLTALRAALESGRGRRR